jgi:hypothetical protein
MRTKQKMHPNFSIVVMEVNKLSTHLGAHPTVHVNEVNEFDNSREEKQQLVADCIKLLEVYKELGGNLWTTERELNIENLLEKLVENCRSLDETFLDFQEKVKKVVTTPKSLLSICKINIVWQMGRSFWTNVSQLPLPDALLEYLVHYPHHSATETDYMAAFIT